MKVSGRGSARGLSRALSPYWDWRIEEQGGPDEAGSWIEGSLKGGDYWWGAFMGGKLVGTTLVSPDFYEPGEARFNGVYALPEMRAKVWESP